ncbi:hypothetical protein MMC13_003136 [Lambiella insularis]|nr:hypothetical protein [Lambiella insularis]
MPAPLAKGIIFSISILLAAGFAVYENPQVRQWVDETRHKIAIALHNLGDEINPPRSPRRSSTDASTREDISPEAVERRRRAREEILERGRVMEERRRARSGQTSGGGSFDDLVDEEGKLKTAATNNATTTAAETIVDEEGLRKRNTAVAEEALGAAMGAMIADPFADEKHMDFETRDISPADATGQQSRESTNTIPGSPPTSISVPQQPEEEQLLINTEVASNHSSELLVDLTPTTSHSSAHDDLSELSPQVPQNLGFYSVNEWAENSTASFHSPPHSEAGYEEHNQSGQAVSDTGTGEHVEGMSDVDMISEAGDGLYTPSSWTEVGSVVSEED